MNKKILISIGLVGGLLLITGVVHASELEESLKAYLADPNFDWLGSNYDKILFENIIKVSTGNLNDAELFAKLKFVIEDIKTMPLQLKCTAKVIEQNAPAYAALGGVGGLKMAIGGKEFNKLAFKVLKLLFR